MRLYLSSFGLGNEPTELRTLLKGGVRAAVILNAKDGSSATSRAASLEQELEALRDQGLAPFELDLRGYFGRSDELRTTLSQVNLLWIRGGNTFVLRRAMRQSGLDDLLPELLLRDAIVYGGFSAAVAVIAPTLKGLERIDDFGVIPEGYGAEAIWNGLGLLPFAIAPHYRSAHPESSAIEALVQHFIDNQIPFVALRDGEVLIVDGEERRVVGKT